MSTPRAAPAESSSSPGAALSLSLHATFACGFRGKGIPRQTSDRQPESLRLHHRVASPPPRDMGTDLKIKSPPNTRRAFYYIAINRSSYSAAFSSAAGASAAGVAGASAAGAAASAAAGAALFFERRVRVAFLAAFSLSMFSL